MLTPIITRQRPSPAANQMPAFGKSSLPPSSPRSIRSWIPTTFMCLDEQDFADTASFLRAAPVLPHGSPMQAGPSPRPESRASQVTPQNKTSKVSKRASRLSIFGDITKFFTPGSSEDRSHGEGKYGSGSGTPFHSSRDENDKGGECGGDKEEGTNDGEIKHRGENDREGVGIMEVQTSPPTPSGLRTRLVRESEGGVPSGVKMKLRDLDEVDAGEAERAAERASETAAQTAAEMKAKILQEKRKGRAGMDAVMVAAETTAELRAKAETVQAMEESGFEHGKERNEIEQGKESNEIEQGKRESRIEPTVELKTTGGRWQGMEHDKIEPIRKDSAFSGKAKRRLSSLGSMFQSSGKDKIDRIATSIIQNDEFSQEKEVVPSFEKEVAPQVAKTPSKNLKKKDWKKTPTSSPEKARKSKSQVPPFWPTFRCDIFCHAKDDYATVLRDCQRLVTEAGGEVIEELYPGGFLYDLSSGYGEILQNPLADGDQTVNGSHIRVKSLPRAKRAHPNPLGSHPPDGTTFVPLARRAERAGGLAGMFREVRGSLRRRVVVAVEGKRVGGLAKTAVATNVVEEDEARLLRFSDSPLPSLALGNSAADLSCRESVSLAGEEAVPASPLLPNSGFLALDLDVDASFGSMLGEWGR
ncbi:hypothetical protein TI39_contig4132g00009 [Zymoseptoria brevis]|uniref:Uncharacterized protein n=1 Tax=Zymoseptoria brevis TaxID=1047168 RepID=A0A0F4GDR5_9PEZI|nr:hypothetical protein TI39_contig4132g00009 [Zymoseptoria brevis]